MSDENEPPRKGVLDELEELKDRAARKAAAETAKRTVSKVANELLDDLEEFLLGRKGAAEEILRKEAGVDALDRVREAHGVDGDPDEDDPDEDDPGEDDPGESEGARLRRERRERALAQLEELKRLRAEDADGETALDDGEVEPVLDDEPPEGPARPKVRRRL